MVPKVFPTSLISIVVFTGCIRTATGLLAGAYPTPCPTPSPAPYPTPCPTPCSTSCPTPYPTPFPTPFPTAFPTALPTVFPTPFPTAFPTPVPMAVPTPFLTPFPTPCPTPSPTPISTYPLGCPMPHPNTWGDTQLQRDVLLLTVGFMACFLSAYTKRAMGWIAKVRRRIVTTPVIDKAAFDGKRRAGGEFPAEEQASPKKLHGGYDSSNDSRDQVGHEIRRREHDKYVIECMLTLGVANTTSKVVEVMHSCIRLEHGIAAVKLFDHMLRNGTTKQAHLVGKPVSHKFFKLVAETLDDERMQKDGLRLLSFHRAYGINPARTIQNRLIAAWNNRPPEPFLKHFLEMKSAGVILSRLAYRCIVVAYEHSDPEFAVKIYDEMEGSGVQLDRPACNAVLGALSQLGMHNKARELFMKMADIPLAPNEKTYVMMIKVFSASHEFEEAVALFETMREQCLEPDRYTCHRAILSCIALRRIDHAVVLYDEMVRRKLPLLADTSARLSEACGSLELTAGRGRAGEEEEAARGPRARGHARGRGNAGLRSGPGAGEVDACGGLEPGVQRGRPSAGGGRRPPGGGRKL